MSIANTLIPIVIREVKVDDLSPSDVEQIIEDITTLYDIDSASPSTKEVLFVKYHTMAELYRVMAARRADSVDSTFSTITFQMQDQFRNWLNLAKEMEAKAEKIGAQLDIGQEHLFGRISVGAVVRKTPWVDGYAKDE